MYVLVVIEGKVPKRFDKIADGCRYRIYALWLCVSSPFLGLSVGLARETLELNLLVNNEYSSNWLF